ncbi:MAG TPA: hypothetical protein VF081_08800 [Solirubrobacterales bacterium]
MNGRRAIVGLCMLCALLVSAFAAQSASAVTNGTTAFTCVKGGGDKSLRGEHCLTTGTATKEYGHGIIFQDTTTELTGTNAKTESETTKSRIFKLRTTIGGIGLELQATGASASGWMENRLANSVHFIWAAGGLTLTGVTVKEPAGRGCQVFTDKEEAIKTEGEIGVIHSRELRVDTYIWGDAIHIDPLFLGSFANFFITCTTKLEAIEGTWECTGSVNGVPNGATVDFTHATVTAENTLKCRGAKAAIDGSLTLSGRANSGQSYTPLAATTVSTG